MGEAEPEPIDQQVAGMGLLALLAAAGQERGLVVVVDDVHLLDPESLNLIAFVSRRIHTEPFAMVLAGQEAADPMARLAGIPRVTLAGLPSDDAVRLLQLTRRRVHDEEAVSPRSEYTAPRLTSTGETDRRDPAILDPLVARHIAAATGGNPLALVDLAEELTTQELTDAALSDVPLPVGRHLTRHYATQLRSLPPDARTWVLLAAADSTGNLVLIDAAGDHLQLPVHAHEPAEAADIVDLTAPGLFRHPMIRSAAYNASCGGDRRRAHSALADAAEELGLDEIGAWHAGRAVVGADDEVADRLEAAAEVAGRRGGRASQARVLAQAAAKSTTPAARDTRLVSAAEAADASGSTRLAAELLAHVNVHELDAVTRGRKRLIEANLRATTPEPNTAAAASAALAAADLFSEHDPRREQEALVRAWDLYISIEETVDCPTWKGLGRSLARAATHANGPTSRVLNGLAQWLLEPYATAFPAMSEAVHAFSLLTSEDLQRYGCSSVALTAAVWDPTRRIDILQSAAEAASESGSLHQLERAQRMLIQSHVMGGSPLAARNLLARHSELRRVLDLGPDRGLDELVRPWFSDTARGGPLDGHEGAGQCAGRDQNRAASHRRATTLATGVRAADASTPVRIAQATVALAHSHYAQAYALLAPLVDQPRRLVAGLPIPDLVEASVRTDRLAEADARLHLLEEVAETSASPWAQGVAARSRALLSTGDDAEHQFRLALDLLDSPATTVDRGRAHLLYGEWLRRTKRRNAAAEELKQALSAFESVGAEPFAERAKRELVASGEKVAHVQSTSPVANLLTPQELAVAKQAASGHTNAEIAATMFLSVNTIDYHLRKVFNKLGISSRRQLADRIA
ncbi:LuxR family transcriptional regulator [Nocardioides aestuarii]